MMTTLASHVKTEETSNSTGRFLNSIQALTAAIPLTLGAVVGSTNASVERNSANQTLTSALLDSSTFLHSAQPIDPLERELRANSRRTEELLAGLSPEKRERALFVLDLLKMVDDQISRLENFSEQRNKAVQGHNELISLIQESKHPIQLKVSKLQLDTEKDLKRLDDEGKKAEKDYNDKVTAFNRWLTQNKTRIERSADAIKREQRELEKQAKEVRDAEQRLAQLSQQVSDIQRRANQQARNAWEALALSDRMGLAEVARQRAAQEQKVSQLRGAYNTRVKSLNDQVQAHNQQVQTVERGAQERQRTLNRDRQTTERNIGAINQRAEGRVKTFNDRAASESKKLEGEVKSSLTKIETLEKKIEDQFGAPLETLFELYRSWRSGQIFLVEGDQRLEGLKPGAPEGVALRNAVTLVRGSLKESPRDTVALIQLHNERRALIEKLKASRESAVADLNALDEREREAYKNLHKIQDSISVSTEVVGALKYLTWIRSISGVRINPEAIRAINLTHDALSGLEKGVQAWSQIENIEEREKSGKSLGERIREVITPIGQTKAELFELRKTIDALQIGLVDSNSTEFQVSLDLLLDAPVVAEQRFRALISTMESNVAHLEALRPQLSEIASRATVSTRALNIMSDQFFQLWARTYGMPVVSHTFGNAWSMTDELKPVVGGVASSANRQLNRTDQTLTEERRRLENLRNNVDLLFSR